MHLRLFKNNGTVLYDKSLQIPSSERIPALTRSEEGYKQVYTVLVAYLQQSLVNLNLKKGLNEDQLLELADLIIEESKEDNLSLEDVLLFLQQLVTGKAGIIYDRLDIPSFFKLFEPYREQRHIALQYMRYEIHANYKSMGDPTRTSEQLQEQEQCDKRAFQEYNLKNGQDI